MRSSRACLDLADPNPILNIITAHRSDNSYWCPCAFPTYCLRNARGTILVYAIYSTPPPPPPPPNALPDSTPRPLCRICIENARWCSKEPPNRAIIFIKTPETYGGLELRNRDPEPCYSVTLVHAATFLSDVSWANAPK